MDDIVEEQLDEVEEEVEVINPSTVIHGERMMELPLVDITGWNDANGNVRASYQITLVSGSHPKDYQAVIEPGGNQIKITMKWNPYFLDSNGVPSAFVDKKGESIYVESHVRTSAFLTKVKELRNEKVGAPVESIMRINLPFTCEEQFVDGNDGFQLLRSPSGLFMNLELMCLKSSYAENISSPSAFRMF